MWTGAYESLNFMSVSLPIPFKTSRTHTAKQEAEALINQLLLFAEKMLVEHGEFCPYGGYMADDGKIVHVSATGSTENPASKELIELLRRQFCEGARREEYRATAVVFDVRIAPPGAANKTDTIQVCVDHKRGYSAEVFFPYNILQDGSLELGSTFAQERENLIFSST